MNHPACSPERLEGEARGVGPSAALCVIHLIVAVPAALIAIGLLAVFAPPA